MRPTPSPSAFVASLLSLLVVAGCNSSSSTPTSPTASSTTAAADGSTLKVSAPSGLLPASGSMLESRRPTLQWSEAAGTFVRANVTYELQVLLNGATIAEIAVAGTSYAAETDLTPDTTYAWRVRARQETAAGPWSEAATFTTPKSFAPRSLNPLPFDPPAACGPLPNQPGDRIACVRAVAALSPEWGACMRASKVGCFKFTRHIAQALAAGDPRWGMISKNPGDTQCTMETCGALRGEGYGEDVVAYLPAHDDTNRWIGFDTVLGAGGNSPGVNWGQLSAIRPGNRWVPVPF